jgi:hypothetical protein
MSVATEEAGAYCRGWRQYSTFRDEYNRRFVSETKRSHFELAGHTMHQHAVPHKDKVLTGIARRFSAWRPDMKVARLECADGSRFAARWSNDHSCIGSDWHSQTVAL